MRALAAGGFSSGARAATGGDYLAAADCGYAAKRWERLCAVGDVARVSGGAARRYAGYDDSWDHGGARTEPDSSDGERARGGDCERAEPDEFHEPACGAAPL